jgi:hypothetical protein
MNSNNNVNYKKSPHRELFEASGISCLPGKIFKNNKENEVSISTLIAYKKTFEGNNPLKDLSQMITNIDTTNTLSIK